MTDKRTILIAGMGTSPAVLTETVWALCHQKKPMVPQRGNPVTFPMGRIVVLNSACMFDGIISGR